MDTKVRDAFEKVKLDITLLRENLLANYKEDREREKSIIKLTKEIIALKKRVATLEAKVKSTSRKASVKKKVTKKTVKRKK